MNEPDLPSTVYNHLRAIAQRLMNDERAGHTLSATALVHELYLRIPPPTGGTPDERAAYYRIAADAMRHVLIDYARQRKAKKRGGGNVRSVSDLESLATAASPEEIVALDAAFLRLQEQDQRAADVVRLRFFAGLSVDETAEALGLSRRTVLREWEYARALLWTFLQEQSESSS